MKTLVKATRIIEAEEVGQLLPRLRLKSQEIFNGHKVIVIEHGGEEYHLRLTKLNKLILTK